MVDADLRKSSRGVTNLLEDRDVVPAAMMGVSVAGGLLAAQELSDYVLPQLGMSRDPSSPTGLGASAAVKTVGAAATVALASRGGDAVMTYGGLAAVGMLAHAGLDLFDVVQRGGIIGSMPGVNNSSGSATVKKVPANSGSPSASRSTSRSMGVQSQIR